MSNGTVVEMNNKNLSHIFKYRKVAILIAVSTTGILVGCNGDNSSTPSSDRLTEKGLKLPYDLYMPSGPILNDWGHDAKTLLKWDEKRGVYYLNNIKAGDTSTSEPRRFKLTASGWTHQFGFGPNGDATAVDSSKIVFSNNSSINQLNEYSDSKDIYLPLDEDINSAGKDVLLDFTVKVLDPTLDASKIELTVQKDLPPIVNSKILKLSIGSNTINMAYVGDGNYQGAFLLEANSETSVSLNSEDSSSHYQFGTISDGQTQGVTECSDACDSTVKAGERFYYQLIINVASNGVKKASLGKLTLSEAKAVAPHFDADGTPLSVTFAPYPYVWMPETDTHTTIVSVKDKLAQLRTFTISSDAPQRDNGPTYRVFTEDTNQPRVHSGNLMFDALFAQAIDDMKLNSVSKISDSSYNEGAEIDCNCFQTGEQWKYVWTRDLSYAANLALANMDPQRVVNSMLFKTSGFRTEVTVPSTLPESTAQIIQDTGSGGSWPVSTDRVTWALAARSVINSLTGDDLADFKNKAYKALRGTVEADREASFDTQQGLYGGEQSYMDWRTQTYAPWIINNLSRMSSSKSLSTNVAHYEALRLTADLAVEFGDTTLAEKYNSWADALKNKINDKFWLDDVGMYATMTTSAEDQAPVHKYDMLGTALVILSGIAPDDRAASTLKHYPHAPLGVPVYYPQQPDIAPYHNRALWPFVTDYALRAAAKLNNAEVANNAISSLYRGAAMNLSNMENLEWLSGKPDYSGGPIINSRRQLWSIAGYLDMVMSTIFGYHVDENGIKIKPFLTSDTRKLLGSSNVVTLENINYKGSSVNIQLQLPDVTDAKGYYPIDNIRLSDSSDISSATSVSENLISANLITQSTSSMPKTIIVQFGSLIPADSRANA